MGSSVAERRTPRHPDRSQVRVLPHHQISVLYSSTPPKGGSPYLRKVVGDFLRDGRPMESVIKKYTRATVSSDLTSDAYHTDTDALAAVALSDKEMGSLLFRVKYAYDASSYKRLEEFWRYFVKVKAVVHNWPQHINEQVVADQVLAYWLNNQCRPCGGRGYLELIPRVLDDDPCPHCDGSGKRPIEVNGRLKKYVLEMLDTIERLMIQASGQAMEKLASDMRL